MRRAIVVAALAATLVAVSGAARAQPRCAGAKPEVTFELDMQPAGLSHERSMAELTREKNDADGHHLTGLYHFELIRRTEVSVRIVQTGDRVCAAVSRVSVRAEMPTRVIYVANDLEPGSCRYRVTLEHERDHERIDDDFIRRRLEVEMEALRADFPIVATAAPVRATARDQTVAELRARALAIVDRLFERLLYERHQAQRAIDTPYEYARLGALCH